MDTAVLLAIFGIFTAIFGVITLMIKGGFKFFENLSKSLDANTTSNREIAEATRQQAREAEQRNGHLAEITVQSRDQVLAAIQNVGEQHVTKQVVDRQTIKK